MYVLCTKHNVLSIHRSTDNFSCCMHCTLYSNYVAIMCRVGAVVRGAGRGGSDRCHAVLDDYDADTCSRTASARSLILNYIPSSWQCWVSMCFWRLLISKPLRKSWPVICIHYVWIMSPKPLLCALCTLCTLCTTATMGLFPENLYIMRIIM